MSYAAAEKFLVELEFWKIWTNSFTTAAGQLVSLRGQRGNVPRKIEKKGNDDENHIQNFLEIQMGQANELYSISVQTMELNIHFEERELNNLALEEYEKTVLGSKLIEVERRIFKLFIEKYKR